MQHKNLASSEETKCVRLIGNIKCKLQIFSSFLDCAQLMNNINDASQYLFVVLS